MKIYHTSPNMLVLVQPGNEFPDNTDWKDKEGNKTMFPVQFKAGIADVAGNLGKYMLDKGLARRSPIILPGDTV
jgi:hypothetical protein